MDNLLLGKLDKLDDCTYVLDYKNDYALDMLLDRGVRSVADLARTMQKHFGAKAGELKMSSGGFACTTFNAFTPSGDHILARNFDYKDAPAIVVLTSPQNGYRSIAVTETNVMLYGNGLNESKNKNRLLLAPYACMDGINEKGLAIGVLEIKTSATNQSTGKTDIITTVMIRAVLDKCATVQEAVDLFSQFDMHDSLFCNYHYHITDANGSSVVIEYVNNEMRLVYPYDKTQHVMNFYLSKDGDATKGFGYTRQQWVIQQYRQNNGIMTEQDAMALLQKCKLDYKHRRGYQITSLWSAVYNCNQRTLLLTTGMHYDKNYTFGL